MAEINPKNISIYSDEAERFAIEYNSVSFESVHRNWISLLGSLNTKRALDIGAGSGRDSLGLSQLGLDVVAVEPAENLRELGKVYTGNKVSWHYAQLPDLVGVEGEFSLILISAVWMHLSQQEQHLSLHRLSSLLCSSGLLIISIRHGHFTDGRTALYVDELDTIRTAATVGLSLVDKLQDQEDILHRKDIYWTTLVFKRS